MGVALSFLLRAMAGVAAFCCATAAFAQPVVVSSAPDDLALTVYRDGLALVTEKRRFDLPAGRSTIEFRGVNDRIIPQSALLNEFGAVVIERNFDFDVLTPASFFAKSVGKTVVLTRTNRASGRVARTEARIVSAAAFGGVMLDTRDGFEAYQCSGLPETIGAASLPEGLKALPTLSMTVVAEKAGPQEMTISYLADGFSWNADYVLTLKSLPRASLLGWLTLSNTTSTSIENADTSIVAGTLQVTEETASESVPGSNFWARCWPQGSTKRGIAKREPPARVRDDGDRTMMRVASPAAESAAMQDEIIVTGSRIPAREDLGDYKLYRLPERTTVAAHQTKQVAFLDKNEVRTSKRYAFKLQLPDDFDETPQPAPLEYSVDNTKDGLLAEPLPAGTIRIYAPSSGGALYLGEDAIPDLAVGLPVEAMAAQSLDVRMQTRVLARSQKPLKNGSTSNRLSMEHVVSNASGEAAEIEISLGNDYSAAFRIDAANVKPDKSEPLPTFRFTVAPNASRTLTYRAEWTD